MHKLIHLNSPSAPLKRILDSRITDCQEPRLLIVNWRTVASYKFKMFLQWNKISFLNYGWFKFRLMLLWTPGTTGGDWFGILSSGTFHYNRFVDRWLQWIFNANENCLARWRSKFIFDLKVVHLNSWRVLQGVLTRNCSSSDITSEQFVEFLFWLSRGHRSHWKIRTDPRFLKIKDRDC